MVTRFTIARCVATSFFMLAAGLFAASEEDFYTIHSVDLPDDVVLEVGGIVPLTQDRILVCTRHGEVFAVDQAYSTPWKPTFKRWAFGLGEPLGLIEHEGWIYTAQRGELTRMKDTDGDDKADVFETVSDAWGISGAYHEYNFGPRLDKEGFMWVTLNKPFGSQRYGRAAWRGWAVRINPKTGEMQPMATGLRSPAGVEISPQGDVFYSDNQGEWCNASKLSHIEPGDFHGHVHGLPDVERPDSPIKSPRQNDVPNGDFMKDLKQKIPNFKMPAVWFPYARMGNSPSGIQWDVSNGKFGPFAGQCFVADQTAAKVMRVFLEKIDGHWQGACFDFRKGFECGIIRIEAGHDGSMFVGMSNRGWGGAGGKPYGLQRLTWTGKVPFEIHEMRAKPDGFEISFTHPIDKATGSDLKSYSAKSYTYRLRGDYGGPDEDIQEPAVKSATVSGDGKSVRITLESVRAGYVHELHLKGIRSQSGDPLLHEAGYYTLVNIPKN